MNCCRLYDTVVESRPPERKAPTGTSAIRRCSTDASSKSRRRAATLSHAPGYRIGFEVPVLALAYVVIGHEETSPGLEFAHVSNQRLRPGRVVQRKVVVDRTLVQRAVNTSEEHAGSSEANANPSTSMV